MIHWFPWGQEAFSKAQAENKPVLLSISAVWCYWCHVMDETTYSDRDVVRLLTDKFIAIRVDSDQRPDINARYNVGGWPTTAFLTDHGGLIGGATYLPPDQLLAMMAELQGAYANDKPRLYDQARELHQHRRNQAGRVAAGADLEATLVDSVARVVTGAYDARNGGFGAAPKFPSPQIPAFAVHLARTTGEDFYRAMVRKTLDAMNFGELQDREEGGFFRHCAEADWTEPQLEKLLEDNLGIAQLFLDAGCLLNDDSYKETAGRTVDWLMEHLYDAAGPGFYASQGSHSEYFGLPMESRRRLSSRRWTPVVTRLPTPKPSVCCWKRPGSWGVASWQTPHCRSWRPLILWPSKGPFSHSPTPAVAPGPGAGISDRLGFSIERQYVGPRIHRGGAIPGTGYLRSPQS